MKLNLHMRISRNRTIQVVIISFAVQWKVSCAKETEYTSLSMVSFEEEELGETNEKFELDRMHRIR